MIDRIDYTAALTQGTQCPQLRVVVMTSMSGIRLTGTAALLGNINQFGYKAVSC